MKPPQTSNRFLNLVMGGLMVGSIGMTSVVYGFDLQGHRGARGLMPENTLPGFATALAIGVTTLELDLAVTGDGQVVVIHNPRFEPEIARHSNGEWLQQSSPSINSMNLETVKSYDVGRLNPAHKYAQRYPQQQALDGVSVPTLEEVFELVNNSGNRSVRFNIEIKINPEDPQLTLPPKEFVEAVIEVIRSYKLEDRVALQSFDWRALREVQDLAPEIATSYLTADQRWLSNLQTGIPGPSPWLNGIDIDDFDGSAARAIKTAGGDIWSAYHKEIDADAIKVAHDLGLKVTVWTVNEASRMRELIAMGVDGIITDYPDRLRRVVADLGMPLPMATPVYATDFDYPLKQVTDKIQVLFGPVELPDSNNRGFRNNVVIVRTSKGIVLMDPGGSAWAGEMVAKKIESMHEAPVVAVFNSHAHGDHWLGNEGIKRHFPDAVIYGHPKMKARLEHSDGITWLETINRVTDNLADGKQVVAPDRTVNDGDVITVADTEFRIIHTGSAHTDNDIMIEVVGEDALFVGDVVRDHFLGLMEEDASFRGNIEAIDKIAGLNFKYYIPGHGNVGDIETPLSYRAYLKSLRDMVVELFDEGVESYEMKPRIMEALSDYQDWSGFDSRLGGHISRAYLEVEQEEFE